jgi:hypothetical protein
MDARNNIATDLFYKIRSRFKNLKLGAEDGGITIIPDEARFFDFDYIDDDVVIGHVSVSLAEPNSMKVYFSSGITDKLDKQEKNHWYLFLRELRTFAKRRLLSFDTRDIAKDNLDKRDYEFLSKNAQPKQTSNNVIQKSVGESVMKESAMYGSRTISYQKLMDTRLIVKHNQALVDDTQPGARTRHISGLFVENADGERFKYPFIHLAGARAMQRHVANGGVPYDSIGESIVKMSEEIAQLKSFGGYVVRNDLMNSDTNSIVERSSGALTGLREQIKALSKQRNYENYKQNFQEQSHEEIPQDIVEQFKEQFTVKSFKEDIASVFPVLYRLMKEGESLEYDDVVGLIQDEITENSDYESEHQDEFVKFESWVNSLGESSNITSEDPEQKQSAVQELQKLVSEHFAVGVDGSNAIESLKGIIDDQQFFQGIRDTAKEDPDADLRGAIKQWLELYASDVAEEIDFGDFESDSEEPVEAPVEEPVEAPVEEPAEDPMAQPEEDPMNQPTESREDDYGDNHPPKKMDVPAAIRKSKGDKDWKTTPSDIRNDRAKNMSSSEWIKKFNNEGSDEEIKPSSSHQLAEFIHSFYDKESNSFPKGPEGVCTMVGKKFGEQAENVARKFVERMAPQQTDNTVNELSRIRELSGMKEAEAAEFTDNTVNEISKKTLGSYVKKANADATYDANIQGYNSGKKGSIYNDSEEGEREKKRRMGIDKAVDRLSNENAELTRVRRLSGL